MSHVTYCYMFPPIEGKPMTHQQLIDQSYRLYKTLSDLLYAPQPLNLRLHRLRSATARASRRYDRRLDNHQYDDPSILETFDNELFKPLDHQNNSSSHPGLYYDQQGISWKKEPITFIYAEPKHRSNCYCDLCLIDRSEQFASVDYDRDEIPF